MGLDEAWTQLRDVLAMQAIQPGLRIASRLVFRKSWVAVRDGQKTSVGWTNELSQASSSFRLVKFGEDGAQSPPAWIIKIELLQPLTTPKPCFQDEDNNTNHPLVDPTARKPITPGSSHPWMNEERGVHYRQILQMPSSQSSQLPRQILLKMHKNSQ